MYTYTCLPVIHEKYQNQFYFEVMWYFDFDKVFFYILNYLKSMFYPPPPKKKMNAYTFLN